MKNESVTELIKDLSARLNDAAALAEQFGDRVSQLVNQEQKALAAPRKQEQLYERAQALMEERAARLRHFPEDLFHEPAWDLLLALFLAYGRNEMVNVKTLVAASNAPPTTSQRWLIHLDKLGLVNRVVDDEDRRRIEVSLSDEGYHAMSRYLQEIAEG